MDEAISYFRDNGISTEEQAAAFNAYIDGDKYLRPSRAVYRAQCRPYAMESTGRSALCTRVLLWRKTVHHFHGGCDEPYAPLNSNRGNAYFSPNTFNSTPAPA